MSNEEKEKKAIPTYAPTEEEMAQTGAPATPEEYPLFKKLDAIVKGIDNLTAEVKKATDAIVKAIPLLTGNIVNVSTAKTEVKTVPKPAEKPAEQPQPETKASKLEEVKMAFPEDLEALLYFEEKDGYVILKPRQFLGSENFAKIASAVRGLGGEYISAGKDSHFRVKA